MKRILVAEDISDTNDLICGLLEKNGFQVTQATNGSEAIICLGQKDKYNLILLDIIMPIQDGFDVLDYMNENDIQIPVIAMSGGGRTVSGSIALKAVQDRVATIIKKPFKQNELMEAINKIL